MMGLLMGWATSTDGQTNAVANGAIRSQLTSDSTISVEKTAQQRALRQLLVIGASNRIPMGIVLGEDLELCDVQLELNEDRIKIGDLLSLVNRDVKGYKARLDSGVINVLPVAPSQGVSDLLSIRIKEFHTVPDQPSLLGVSLWFFIRSVIAPNEVTAFAGASSISEKSIPALSLSNRSVQEILNTIVDQGDGGVWTLNAAAVRELSPRTKLPYEIREYSADKPGIQGSTICPN